MQIIFGDRSDESFVRIANLAGELEFKYIEINVILAYREAAD